MHFGRAASSRLIASRVSSTLDSLGKLILSAEALQQALDDLGIHVLPYTAAHAKQLFSPPPSRKRSRKAWQWLRQMRSSISMRS